MKRISLLMFCLSALTSLRAQDQDIETVKKLNQDWLKAYITKDSAVLNRIFAEDFQLISPGGAKMTRNDILHNLARQEVVSINIDSVEVKMLTAEVAILTAYTSFVMKNNGMDTPMRNCYQDIYVKRNQRWWAVSAHVTLLGMK